MKTIDMRRSRRWAWTLAASLLVAAPSFSANLDTKSLHVRTPTTVGETAVAARLQGSFTVKGTVWQCTGNRCASSTLVVTGLSPVALCQALAHEVGAIRSFIAAAHALTAGELQRCNATIAMGANARILTTKPAPVFRAKSVQAPLPNARTLNAKAKTIKTPAHGFVATSTSRVINTTAISFNGRRFVAKTVATPALVLTGTRFVEKSVTTPAMAFNGQRFLPRTLSTATLQLTGLRQRSLPRSKTQEFEPIIINTDGVLLIGQRFNPAEFGISSLSFTGNR